MKLILFVTLSLTSFTACSGGKNSVPKRPLFKSLFYLGDNTGDVYKNECPKRAKSGACKTDLVKVKVNFCEDASFKNFQKERYILVKESDFIR